MDTAKKLAASLLVAAFSAAPLVVFRTAPEGRLWEGWRVVYVASGASDSYAERVLSDSGCGDVISFAGQRIPALFPAASPEFSFAVSDLLSDTDGYLARRARYFSDGSGEYRVYYVSERRFREAEGAVAAFQNDGFDAGVDARSVYPFAAPLITVVFALVLCMFSARRLVFFCASLVPVLYSLCLPFYPSAAAVCLLLYAVLLAVQVWGRRGAARFLLSNGTVILFAAGSVMFAWLASVRCGLLFTFALTGCVAVLYALSCADAVRDGRYSFKALPIRPARAMPFVTKKSLGALAACALGIVMLFFAALFSALLSRPLFSSDGVSSFFSARNGGARVRLPAPSADGGLPTLDDYVAWRWNAATMPYRSLNAAGWGRQNSQNPKDGDTLSFSQYVDDGGGIREIVSTITYDGNFRDEVISEIDGFPYPAIEKLMKAQDGRFGAGHSLAAAEGADGFHIVITLLSLCVPALSFLKIKMTRTARGGQIRFAEEAA